MSLSCTGGVVYLNTLPPDCRVSEPWAAMPYVLCYVYIYIYTYIYIYIYIFIEREIYRYTYICIL